jgi:hypothetical protein
MQACAVLYFNQAHTTGYRVGMLPLAALTKDIQMYPNTTKYP